MEEAIKTTQRLGENFLRRIEYIKQKRQSLGLDEKRKSTRAITNLLIKHELWVTLERDAINFKGAIK